MREKMIPCERIKVEDKIQNVAFEPVGSKLAVLVGETPRISLKIFGHEEGKLTELHTFDKVTANTIQWSPRGQFLVAAGLGSLQGVLEFFDTESNTSYNVGEHFMASTVQWDPTGRFVCSLVSCLNYTVSRHPFFSSHVCSLSFLVHPPLLRSHSVTSFSRPTLDTTSGLSKVSSCRESFRRTSISCSGVPARFLSFPRSRSLQSRKTSRCTFCLLFFYVHSTARLMSMGDSLFRQPHDELTPSVVVLPRYHNDFESEDRMAASAASEEVLKKRRDLTEAWEDFQENVLYRASKNREALLALRPPEDESTMNEIIETVDVFVREDVELFEQKIT
jgi:hypothetical protein